MVPSLRISPSLPLLLVPPDRVPPGRPDPAAIRRRPRGLAPRPGPGRGRSRTSSSAPGLATLHLEDGVLLPVSAGRGQDGRVVFLGKGRIVLEPPDEIEAGQLELFTGASSLEEEFTEMVLVLGIDAAVDAMLRKRPAAAPEAAQVQRGEELYAEWKSEARAQAPGRRGRHPPRRAGDPAFQGYLRGLVPRQASWETSSIWSIPEAQEQVTLGRFVPLDATEKEKRKILKEISREQRKGRLIGLELDDLGQWDTWLSASLRDKEGKPSPGVLRSSRRSTPWTELAEATCGSRARARIDLQPVIRGARAALLRLNPNLQVSKVDGRLRPEPLLPRRREAI